MKKLLSILLALVLATGLFAACSGSGSGSQAAGSTASGSGAAAAPDGKKTDLLLWLPPFAAGDDGALDKEFWTETLAPWAAENNVDLTIEITPWGNYEEKYLTGFSSGEGPDVGYMYLEMFNDFIEMGALEPLDAYITDADRENYLYLDKGFIKGKQYTMPFIVGNARILYFNMDILEQAGVTELPATWQDLVDVAVKIKEAGLPGVMPFAGEWADPAIGALNTVCGIITMLTALAYGRVVTAKKRGVSMLAGALVAILAIGILCLFPTRWGYTVYALIYSAASLFLNYPDTTAYFSVVQHDPLLRDYTAEVHALRENFVTLGRALALVPAFFLKDAVGTAGIMMLLLALCQIPAALLVCRVVRETPAGDD